MDRAVVGERIDVFVVLDAGMEWNRIGYRMVPPSYKLVYKPH